MVKTVLFLIPSLGGGGAEKVLVNLVNNLDKTKYDITVQTLFDVGVNRQYLKEHVHYIPGFKKQVPGNVILFKLFSPEFLYRFIIKKRYDIVVSYLEGPTARIVAGCPFDSKLVSWVHTLQCSKENAAYSYRSIDEADFYQKKFNKVICVANGVKNDYLSIYPFAKKMCSVLYNTNETGEILLKSRVESTSIRFSQQLNIISVGRLIPEKGYDRLVNVHKKLLKDGIKHHIYILGDGQERSRIEKLIESEGVEDTFHLLGFSSNPYSVVTMADAFICSSRREGFSTAVTEALILGIPVVSTNCSGATELLGENNEYGIVVENSEEGVYQGMKQMIETPGMLHHYTEKAKERGSFFSKENTVRAVEEMFDGLFKEG